MRSTRSVPNTHPNWPLRSVEIIDVDDELVSAATISPRGPALRPLFSLRFMPVSDDRSGCVKLKWSDPLLPVR